MNIGERLREERERLGKNQTEFAEIGGATRKTQFNYESGDRFPGADYLARIAQHGVDIKYVVVGVRDMSDMTALEQALLAAFRAATPENQGAAFNVLLSGKLPGAPAFQQDFGNAKVGGIFHGDNKADIHLGDTPKKGGKK